jgi:PKD repeat protein
VEVKGQVLQCPEPSNISFSAITPISADVSWSSPSGVSELELVPIGQAQGTGTLFQGVSSPFSLTGLTPATTYVIYLRDSCGSNNYSVWITDTITTLNCPVVTAGFSQNANLLALNFNSSATAADSVYWDFGDGNSSSLSNPSHTYANPSSYSVSQRAYNNCGNGDTLTININVCDSLIANYTHFQSGDTVFFDGSGSVGANEYLWYFGNADTATGATANRIFASSGTKQVSLIVTNACNDTVIVTKNIKVCGPPQAIWTYTNLGTTGSGMKIEFDASASVNATQYEWDFGDGNTNSGSVKPVHTYITPGLFYFVKLTVTNSCGDKNSWRYRLSEIGLEELDLASSLELSPTPATQTIFLEWSFQDYHAQQVSIIDARGRLVMQKNISERQNERLELDVSGLAPGYYSIDLSTNQGSARKAFLKK